MVNASRLLLDSGDPVRSSHRRSSHTLVARSAREPLEQALATASTRPRRPLVTVNSRLPLKSRLSPMSSHQPKPQRVSSAQATMEPRAASDGMRTVGHE